MSCDSVAYLKGFIEPKRIVDYIKNNMDHKMTYDIKWETVCSLDKLNFPDWKETELPVIYSKSPDDLKNWRILSGWFHFDVWGQENWPMFYYYSPLQPKEGLDELSDYDKIEMMNSETTCLRMPACKESIWTLNNIVKYFGGGWLYENDCEEKTFYKIK